MGRLIGIVPARQGSKGVVDKNRRAFAGSNLVTIAVMSALEICDEVVVTSDADDILSLVAGIDRVRLVLRPSILAEDSSPVEMAIKHLFDTGILSENDNCVLLQTTMPFRSASQLAKMKDIFERNNYDALIGVSKLDAKAHPDWSLRLGSQNELTLSDGRHPREIPAQRQLLEPMYTRNDYAYFVKGSFAKDGDLYGNTCIGFLNSESMLIDINSELDFEFAQYMYNKLQNRGA